MSCCGANPGYDELDEVSRLVSAKLAAFLKTLRDNGFAVGLPEGRDAAALMAAGYVEKPTLLRSAFKHLFSARKSDWEKFDGLFDAFWLGKRARRRGYRLDLRRTIHGNINHGGVPISLVKRQRKEKPLRLVVLLDASGSMSMYTGVFLRFIHGVLDEFREAEAFLFHTRLA